MSKSCNNLLMRQLDMLRPSGLLVSPEVFTNWIIENWGVDGETRKDTSEHNLTKTECYIKQGRETVLIAKRIEDHAHKVQYYRIYSPKCLVPVQEISERSFTIVSRVNSLTKVYENTWVITDADDNIKSCFEKSANGYMEYTTIGRTK